VPDQLWWLAKNKHGQRFAFEVPTSAIATSQKINEIERYHNNFIPDGMKSDSASVIGIQSAD
jgi:hypothetical protein